MAPVRNSGSRPAPASPPPQPKSAPAQKPAQNQAAAQKPAQKSAPAQKPAQNQVAAQKPAQTQTTRKPAQAQTAQKPAQAQAAQKPAQTQTAQKPNSDRYIPERNTKDFSNNVRDKMQRLANNDKATHTPNRDGSVTSKNSSTDVRGITRSEELSTRQGDLKHSNVKYTNTTKNGNEEIKSTYTSQSDLFGRTQSSVAREKTKTSGDKATGETTSTHSDTKTKSTFGLVEKRTEADSVKVTTGDDKKSTSQELKSEITTDKHGNRAETNTETTTRKNDKTTVTTSRKDTTGTELKTDSSVKFEDGKFTVGESVERKKHTFNTERSGSREIELQPGKADQGFSQVKNGPVNRAQTAGNVLGAMGLKKELFEKYEVPEDQLIKNNWLGDDKNNFVGTRHGWTGSQEGSWGADGVNASYKREYQAGFYAESKGDHHNTSFKAEHRRGVEGKAKVDTNGVDASGSAKISVGAEVSGTLKAEHSFGKYGDSEPKVGVEGTVKASATASAEASGKVKITRNPPTAIAEGTIGASAVAKIEGEVKGTAGPFSVKANVYGSAGAEAKATGSIGFEDGKLKLSGSLGAAVGLGAGGGATVEVDVKMIGDVAKVKGAEAAKAIQAKATEVADVNGDGKLGMDDAKAIAKEVQNTVKNTVNEAKATVQNTVNEAKATVNNAKNKVLGWLGW